MVVDTLSRLEITHKDSQNCDGQEKQQFMYMTAHEARSENFPMSPILVLIQKEQNKDNDFQGKNKDDKSQHYSIKKVEVVSLIHFEGKIFVS